MSAEQIEQAESNREAAHLATAEAEEARRRAFLWERPFLSDAEVPDAIGIPQSLWSALKSQGDTPKLFNLGRRLFVRTADLRLWLEEKARDGRPGSKRLRDQAAP